MLKLVKVIKKGLIWLIGVNNDLNIKIETVVKIVSKLLAEQVFKPASFPEYTYVSRKSKDLNIDFELRLKQAIKISGFLTSIVGPSKMGKTVLCEKVIDFKRSNF